MIEQLILDASPFIILVKSGYADVLRSYPSVAIPRSVCDEILAGPTDDKARISLASFDWVEVPEFSEPSSQIRSYELGSGETAVLDLAIKISNSLAAIDDSAARRCARALGVRTIGTGGILLRAYRDGHFDSFENALDDAIDAGLWVGKEMREQLIERSRSFD